MRVGLIGVCLLSPLWAAKPFSLMLSQAEQEALKHATQTKKATKKATPLSGDTRVNEHMLYLSTIMYFDANRWTIWLNDSAIHKNDPLPWPLKLCEVSPHTICIELASSPTTKLTLRPHQSVDMSTGQIADGDQRMISSFFSPPEDVTNNPK